MEMGMILKFVCCNVTFFAKQQFSLLNFYRIYWFLLLLKHRKTIYIAQDQNQDCKVYQINSKMKIMRKLARKNICYKIYAPASISTTLQMRHLLSGQTGVSIKNQFLREFSFSLMFTFNGFVCVDVTTNDQVPNTVPTTALANTHTSTLSIKFITENTTHFSYTLAADWPRYRSHTCKQHTNTYTESEIDRHMLRCTAKQVA